MADENITFEQSMARLDEIVRLLERGDAPLEESLQLFEEGTRLVGNCSKRLEEAEQKVIRLMKGPDGEPLEREFQEDEL